MKSFLNIAFVALFLCASQLQAQPVPIGDVEGADFRPYPIAMANMRAPTEESDANKKAALTAAAISKIVRNDLDICGAFEVLSPRSFIDTDGIALSSVKFEDWLNVKADGLIKSILRPTDDGFTIELHAYEVATAREGYVKRYKGSKKAMREVAHAISDDIFRYFTGEPGVFRTKIAVVRKSGGKKHIWTMDADGDSQRKLTKRGSLNLLPSYSPDGAHVLFTSYRNDNPDLFQIAVSDGKVTRLSSRPGLNTGGQVSADGEKIAITLTKDGNSEVYLLNRNGKSPKRLTMSWGIDTSPAFRPDGKKIAFVSSRQGNPHIFTMNLDGSGQKRITFQGSYNQTPTYSPRGTYIAFTARDEFNRFDIFLIDLRKGNKLIRLTQDQGNNEEPSFSPNGRMLVFTSTRSGSKQVWVSNLDGSAQHQITFGGQHASPVWGPFRKK
ncbi:MAG: Tol-Pal system beta propeller repeat protein TolB [Deltaproteobacteria bacterium]|nr:Tol-Pal system beta propeller repeat protein TolB [Deltaproteobacteria bacterium]